MIRVIAGLMGVTADLPVLDSIFLLRLGHRLR
jgi:hypothetical protein